jgi:small neutral amino acid transporter SnatA (MarC family)
MMAALRLSAFIVFCIGVQIAWNGVKGLIAEIPAAGVSRQG